MSQGGENRREERVQASLRVSLDGNVTGTTRDVSASGIFFETDARYTAGSAIAFAIDIDAPGGKMVLNCRGEIVRVEQNQARVGVAVKILESVLRPATAVAQETAPVSVRVLPL